MWVSRSRSGQVSRRVEVSFQLCLLLRVLLLYSVSSGFLDCSRPGLGLFVVHRGIDELQMPIGFGHPFGRRIGRGCSVGVSGVWRLPAVIQHQTAMPMLGRRSADSEVVASVGAMSASGPVILYDC
jgi:hypothetical protein